VWESITSRSRDIMSCVMSYGLHSEYGKIVHRPYSSCISNVKKLTGTLLSSSCQLRLGGYLSHLRLSHYSELTIVEREYSKLTSIQS